MKKYLYIFKSELMSTFQYKSNLLGGISGYIIIIIIFINLWNYLYNDPTEIINGYTKGEMIWYVIITEIIWSITSGKKLVKKISDDVKTGNIAYNLNKPYNYILYCISSQFGSATIKLLIYIIIGLTIGYISIGALPNINIIEIILLLIPFIIGMIISILLITSIGLLSFYLEDSVPFYWLYSKLILVLGTSFPIEYFPKTIAKILSYSPIASICYGPAKLFVSFNNSTYLKILSVDIIYLILSYLLCYLLYKKGVKKINVNGG